eukprot:6833727-Prymnesium_polylepis.1
MAGDVTWRRGRTWAVLPLELGERVAQQLEALVAAARARHHPAESQLALRERQHLARAAARLGGR